MIIFSNGFQAVFVYRFLPIVSAIKRRIAKKHFSAQRAKNGFDDIIFALQIKLRIKISVHDTIKETHFVKKNANLCKKMFNPQICMPN